jgi:hypothetical protein
METATPKMRDKCAHDELECQSIGAGAAKSELLYAQSDQDRPTSAKTQSKNQCEYAKDTPYRVGGEGG